MPISAVRARPHTRGFSTVEMLVTVVVLMMIGTVAILLFGSTDRARVRTDAAEVALMLQQARLQAATVRQSVEVAYSADSNSFVSAYGTHTVGSGVTVEAAGKERDFTLLIRPSGESSGARIRFAAGSHEATLELDWLTGRVEVLR